MRALNRRATAMALAVVHDTMVISSYRKSRISHQLRKRFSTKDASCSRQPYACFMFAAPVNSVVGGGPEAG